MKRIFFISFCILILLQACNFSQKDNNKKPDNYVVMLSLDGFRWDYTNMTDTPNFDRIESMGVKAKSVQPSFPSKTFPNHYSMATGLVPDHHGIVLNSFFDPSDSSYYKLNDRASVENGKFYQGEPIWNTAEKQGIKAATYFWVGSEADVQEMHPSYWKKYDYNFPFEQRMDSVIHWLSLPDEKRPHLITWYIHEPDKTGHIFGPESEETRKMVSYLDSLLGVFMYKLEALPIADNIDVIITSDHGMAEISNERKIVLTDHINQDLIEVYQGYNPNFVFKAKENYTDSLYEQLSSIDHLLVWKSNEVPEIYNYGTNPRTLDIIACAELGWSVDMFDKEYSGGAHGYDHRHPEMHAIFYAYGPHFKKTYSAPVFNNTDIYNLICHILELQPAPNDGNMDHVIGLIEE